MSRVFVQGVLIGLLGGACAVPAQTGPVPEVKLTGLAVYNGKGHAVLEIKGTGSRAVTLRPILEKGERIDPVELQDIDAESGKVTVLAGGKVMELRLPASESKITGRSLHFDGADSSQVLDIYQKISGHTVMYSPMLRGAKVSMKAWSIPTDEAAAKLLIQSLAGEGIVVEPRWEKFAVAVPAAQRDDLDRLHPPPQGNANPVAATPAAGNETFPPGLLQFRDADVRQVLEIHQELTGRTLLLQPNLRPRKITVRTQTALNRKEAVWLIESLLALGGIASTPKGGKFLVLTSLADAARVAEIPEPPAPGAGGAGEEFPPGLIKFNQAELAQVLEIYQDLSGRSVVRSSALGSPQVTVRSQTPLNRAEAIWMLEAALHVSGVAMMPDGERLVFALAARPGQRVPELPPNPAVSTLRDPKPILAGGIKFMSADRLTVLETYAALLERKVSPDSAKAPAARLSFRNQTELTRAEAVRALEALAVLNNLRFILSGENEVSAVPAASDR